MPRNAASKWDGLDQWFAEELNMDDEQRCGEVIAELITEKEIGNRYDEMAKYRPKIRADQCARRRNSRRYIRRDVQAWEAPVAENGLADERLSRRRDDR